MVKASLTVAKQDCSIHSYVVSCCEKEQVAAVKRLSTGK